MKIMQNLKLVKLKSLFEKEDHGYYVGHGDNYLLIKVQSDEAIDRTIEECYN